MSKNLETPHGAEVADARHWKKKRTLYRKRQVTTPRKRNRGASQKVREFMRVITQSGGVLDFWRGPGIATTYRWLLHFEAERATTNGVPKFRMEVRG